jgi:hypothetical protein
MTSTLELVDIGPAVGLAVTGTGAPGGATHLDSTKVLYQVAGQVIALAAEHGVDVPMPPLEGFWWVEDDRPPFEVPREGWHWRLFLRMPDGIDPAWVERARDRAPRAAARVALVTVHEGSCVQMIHDGPYADEPRTLAMMDAFMSESGLARRGLHHEIYLTDFATTPPEQARTVLRQPVRSA